VNANNIAKLFSLEGKYSITEEILKAIITLYDSAKIEQYFKEDDLFDSAYHTPITGEFEFFIARILYHLSNVKKCNWKILLRKQENKTAPDIRLLKNNKTIAVIEIKAKAGWMQCFFSPERLDSDIKRFESHKSKLNPLDLIENQKNQLKKYYETFEITNRDVFLLLPTFALVHRKKYTTELTGYYDYFEHNSGLPKENFILLSENLHLNLSKPNPNGEGLMPTSNFENLLTKLLKI
jgi:hypothetical protein